MKLIEELKKLEKLDDTALDTFCATHSITYRLDGSLCLFKYARIGTEWNDLRKECRGVIVDLDTLEVVCYPFNKFFNKHEKEADDIDWSDHRIVEKHDGSLINVWWYKDAWRISTSGTINAFKAEVSGWAGEPTTFGDLFLKAFKKSYGHDFFWGVRELETGFGYNLTYMFELETPVNQIVVKQNDFKLTLIGIRDNLTELELDIIGNYNILSRISRPNQYMPKDLEEFVNSRSKDDHEGVVIVDKNFNRIKVKSADYVKAHKLKEHLTSSPRNIVEAIVHSDTLDDDILILSEYEKDLVRKYQDAVIRYLGEFTIFNTSNLNKSNKELGILIKDYPQFKGLVFGVRKGQSMDDILKKMYVKKLTEYVEMYL